MSSIGSEQMPASITLIKACVAQHVSNKVIHGMCWLEYVQAVKGLIVSIACINDVINLQKLQLFEA